MNIYFFCVLCSLIPHLHADPSPDSIQIQNYDGPIFLHAMKANCCPLCNSLLNQKPINPDPCDEIPEEYLRRTPGTNDGTFPTITQFGTGPSNPYIPTTSVNQFETDLENAYGPVPGNTNSGTILHKNAGKASVTYSVPLALNTLSPNANTHSGSPGNTFTGTAYSGTISGTYPGTTAGTGYPGTYPLNAYTGASENTHNTGFSLPPFCGTPQPTITGTECTCTCVTKPLSSYLPINTSQNTGYKLPIAKNHFGEDEPVLVPQKFSYSLVLDGDVAPFNQRQCDYRCYYS